MATITPSYATPATITMDLNSLASSSDFTAGRESTAVDNTTNKYMDALVSGSVTVGTTPTINTIIGIYVYAQHDDSPTYQDVFDGTDSAETVTSSGVLNGVVALLGSLSVSATTTDRVYYLKPTSVATLFGGVLPKRWGIFVAHNTGVALKSTTNTDTFKYTGIKFDVA
jgi:hypothetical protein